MYKHIIWDFDGTLFDSYPVMTKAFLKTLSNFGIEENFDIIEKLMKVSMIHLLAYCNKNYNLPPDFMSFFSSCRDEVEDSELAPILYATNIIKKIAQSGRTNYIYTHRGNSTNKFLEKYDLRTYFCEVITKDNNFERKPSPDALNYLIKKYSIDKEEAVIVGDRELDLLSGKNAGIYSCFFNIDHKPVPDSTDHVIFSLSEIERFIF